MYIYLHIYAPLRPWGPIKNSSYYYCSWGSGGLSGLSVFLGFKIFTIDSDSVLMVVLIFISFCWLKIRTFSLDH